ncbi:MAG: DUF6259 domain-containing protein [Planctomycetota bacterium JB042]
MRAATVPIVLTALSFGAISDRAAAAPLPPSVTTVPLMTVATASGPSFDFLSDLLELCQGGACDSTPGTVRSLDWRLRIRNRATGAVTPIGSDASTYDVHAWFTWSGFFVEWTDIEHPALPAGLELKVKAKLGWGGDIFLVSTRLYTDLEGPAKDDYSIHGVDFPIVEVNAAPADSLAWPIGTGIVMKNAPTHPVVPILGDFTAHPGRGSMQWFCLYPEADAEWHPSFYMQTRDDDGIYKAFVPEGAPDGGLRFTVRTVPPNSFTATSYDQPFDTVMGLTGDDWHSAATRYRGWAKHRPWTSNGRMNQDCDFSSTIRDMDMFGIFSPDPDFLSWAPWPDRHVEQTTLFATPNIVPQNYGWYDRQFNVRIGDWDPLPEYVAIAQQMASMGVKFSPYTYLHIISFGAEPTVQGYDPSSLGDAVGLRGQNGQLVLGVDSAGVPTFEVCLSTPFAKDYIVQIAQQIDTYGAGGQYLDILNALPPQLCYAPDHGHATPDPENTERRLEIIEAVKDAVSDPEFYVSSESVSETYIGAVELGMSQWTKNTLGTAVDYYPLFETVYNPYTRIGRLGVALNFDTQKLPPAVFQLLSRQTYAADLFFGRTPFAGALLNDDSLLDNIAASPIWGLFIDHVAASVALLKDQDVIEHVTFGERLRDPEVNTARVDLAFLGPLLQLLTIPYGTEQPALYTSAWRDPADGSVLVMIQNWTDPLDNLLLANTVTAQAQSTEPVTTMKAEDLGFDPSCFEEYCLDPMEASEAACLAQECMQSVIAFNGGPQTYCFDYDPGPAGICSSKWQLFHITAAGKTDLGEVSAWEPVTLSGTIPARSVEAYLLVPKSGHH